jgi:hypothetical protein
MTRGSQTSVVLSPRMRRLSGKFWSIPRDL